MITGMADSLKGARDDFARLKRVAQERHFSPRMDAMIKVCEAPGGQVVVFVTTGSPIRLELVKEIAATAVVPEGGHLVFGIGAYPDGFAEALEEAVGRDRTVTLLRPARGGE